jgi:GMC oxidoreductase
MLCQGKANSIPLQEHEYAAVLSCLLGPFSQSFTKLAKGRVKFPSYQTPKKAEGWLGECLNFYTLAPAKRTSYCTLFNSALWHTAEQNRWLESQLGVEFNDNCTLDGLETAPNMTCGVWAMVISSRSWSKGGFLSRPLVQSVYKTPGQVPAIFAEGPLPVHRKVLKLEAFHLYHIQLPFHYITFYSSTFFCELFRDTKMALGRLTDNETYDYIICGGGTAGCVVAGRLAEDTNVKILLVEAGPHNKDLETVHMVGGWSQNFDKETDWNITTESMDGVDGWQVKVSRGRFLGGSSGVNGTLCIRGLKQDYDDWKIEGWSGEEMMKYMEKVSLHRTPLEEVTCRD